MATITKSSTQLSSAQSLTAPNTGVASTNDITSATTFFSCGVAGTIVNGGTGPTIACTVQLQGSIDNTSWYTIDQATGITTATTTTPFAFNLIADGWLYLRCFYIGNTGQTVTVNAVASYGTAFS